MLPRLDFAAPPAVARPAADRTRVAVTGLAVAMAARVLYAAGPSRRELRSMADPASWAEAAGAEAALAQIAGVAAWACLLWLTVGAGAVLAGRAPGAAGRLADRVATLVLPAAVRRAVEAALGVALVAGSVGAPAVTASAQSPSRSSAPVPVAADAGPLERPVAAVPTPAAARVPPSALPRPSTSSYPSATPAIVPSPTGSPSPTRAPSSIDVPPEVTPIDVPNASAAVVVEPGDCLWDIAADYLGDSPSDVDVDRAWRRWYAANRAVVGSNPDLIHPGQRLLPPPDAGTSSPSDGGGPS